MAEQHKENTPLDKKEKHSLLEEDIGKEFLASWKSMSMAGDDPMDFSFDTVGKSKKAFDFDKLDMDFTLDSADFDKLPSFHVDLPELDFSSSSKKCHQDKEKTEEGSLSNRGGKKDSFSFSFDYNELDAFDFGVSMEKGEGAGHKGRDNQVASPLTVESNCFKTNSTKAPVSIGMDGNSDKLSPSNNLTAEKDMRVSLRDLNSSRTASSVPTSSTSGCSVLEKEFGASTERIAVFNAKGDEKNPGGKKDSFSFSFDYNELDAFDLGVSMEKREGAGHKGRDNQVASPLTVESHCFKTNSTKAPVSIGMDGNSNKLSPSNNLTAEKDMIVSLRDLNSSRTANSVPTSSTSGCSILEKEFSASTERIAVFNAKGDEKNQFLEKSVSEARCFLPSTEDNSNLSDGEEVIPSDASGAQISGPGKEDAGDTSFPKHKMDGTDNGKAEVIQDSTPDSLSDARHHSTNRGPEVEKVVPVSKYNDSRGVDSKFYQKPRATMPQPRLDSLLGEKHGDIINKGSNSRSIKLADETRSGRNDDLSQSGRKLVSSLGLASKELTKSHNEVLAIQKFCEKSKKVGVTNSTVTASMLSPTSRDHPDIICIPIDMPSKLSQTTFLLPNVTRAMGSTLTSRLNKADGDKVGSIKSPKNKCGLSSLRNFRTLRTKEDQLSSSAFKENLPIANSEQKTDLKNSELEVARGTNTQKLPSINLSLKRKNLEVANDDIPSFLPLKRISESPKENRSFKVPSERILMKEINDVEIHNTCASSQEETIQVTDSYQENKQRVLLADNEAKAEFSLTCETNSNVSKAEAYAKELEDICDLLRKKHEEAKELLVRALVNNNNLLLLNRPIYDEKIRAVQKFAAELMSKHSSLQSHMTIQSTCSE